MNDPIQIRAIKESSDASMEAIRTMFGEMYAYMREHGLKLDLAGNGAQKWVENVSKGLDRFNCIFLAEENGKPTGFAHGSLRLSPDYLGNKKLGVITHVFVRDEYRKQGVGKKLVLALENWFSEKQVHSVELQVLDMNKAGIAFWQELGYPPELMQCRKIL